MKNKIVIILVIVFWVFVIGVLVLPNLYHEEDAVIEVRASEVSRDESITMLFEADITFPSKPFFWTTNTFELSWSDDFTPYEAVLYAYYGDKVITYDRYEVVGFDETSGVTYGDIKSCDGFDALSKVEIRAYAKKYDTGQKGTAVAALNYHYNYLLKNGSRAGDRYFEY